MKKILTLLFTTIFIFIAASGTLLTSKENPIQGEEEFVNFLVKNKDNLGYKTFGTFEHDDRIEVRVYCSDESRKKIEENIDEFKYKDYNYKITSSGSGILFIVFSKNTGTSEISVPAKDPVKKKCPRKVFVEFQTIKNESFNEFKYFEKGLIDGGISPIVSGMTGKVAKVFFSAGDKIVKGDVILNFDMSKMGGQIKETRTSLKDWKNNLRKRKNWKVRSAKAELQAENKVKEFEAKLEKLLNLQKSNVLLSEKTGQVISIISSGTELNENDEVAKVLDNSVMKMVMDPEDTELLSGLDSLSVRFDNVEDVVTGKIEKTDGKVIVYFDNNDLKLSTKSIAEFKVLVKVYDSVAVLDESKINKDKSGEYVYLVQKKRAKKVYVKTGPSANKKVVILSGLNEGDELITTGTECLYDGKKIKFKSPVPEKKSVKKKQKEIVKKKEPAKKIVKREEKPIVANEVRYMEAKEWSDFDNCPTTLKVKTRVMKKESFSGYETIASSVSSGAVETLTSGIEGIILKVNADEGSEVSRGQLLLSFDIEDMQKRLDNARSSLDEWKKLLANIETWSDRSMTLEKELKEKIRNISLLIPKLGNMISNSNVYSPTDGILTFIPRSGDIVKEGGELVKVEDKTRVRIPVKVDDVLKYNENMKVTVTFDGVSGSFNGKLRILEGKIFAIVDNFSNVLKTGMKAKVNILREYEDVFVGNKSEILRGPEGYYGYIVENKRAKRIDFTIGADKGGKIMIMSGLKSGDELIISQFDCLEDGKKIKIKYFDPIIGKYVIKRTAEERDSLSHRLFTKKAEVGLGLGMYMVSDKIFTNVYGSGVISGTFDLSYNILNRVELFTNVWYIPKAGSSSSITKVDLSMFSFYIGAKYLVNWTGKFLPYIGVAMNSIAVKEKSEELELDTSYRTSVGFSGIGGFYFKIKDNLNLKFDIRYDINKMDIEEFDSVLDFSGIKIALGIAIRF